MVYIDAVDLRCAPHKDNVLLGVYSLGILANRSKLVGLNYITDVGEVAKESAVAANGRTTMFY